MIDIDEFLKEFDLEDYREEIFEFIRSIEIGYGLQDGGEPKFEDREEFGHCKQDMLILRLRLERDKYKELRDAFYHNYIDSEQTVYSIKRIISDFEERKLREAKQVLFKKN